MKKYCIKNYAIQCTDENTGIDGCFFFDQAHWIETGRFRAISDVFIDLYDFYKGTRPEDRKEIYIERQV